MGGLSMRRVVNDRLRRKGIAVFLFISFGWSFLWIFIATHLGLSITNVFVQAPNAFMPAIAAIIVRRWVTKEGFVGAGLSLRWRSSWPHYLAAWIGPWFVTCATLALAAALGFWNGNLSPLSNLIPMAPGWVAVIVLLVGVPLLAPIYWGEEFGWTSYLRPRLFSSNTLLSVLVTGFIWATWHYPLPFVGYATFSNIALGLLVWTGSFILQETILASLFMRSGTIWVTSVAHAGNNLVMGLLIELLLSNGSFTMTSIWLTMIPMAAVCIWIVLNRKLVSRANLD